MKLIFSLCFSSAYRLKDGTFLRGLCLELETRKTRKEIKSNVARTRILICLLAWKNASVRKASSILKESFRSVLTEVFGIVFVRTCHLPAEVREATKVLMSPQKGSHTPQPTCLSTIGFIIRIINTHCSALCHRNSFNP